MFDVDKSVPVAGSRTAWPFKTMDVGDSFALPADAVLIHKARMAAGVYRSRNKALQFSVRKQPDGTARCWRVK